MKQTNKAFFALVAFGVLGASAANAATPAADVRLNSGGDLETAIDQMYGQIGGLSNDAWTAYLNVQRHDAAINQNSAALSSKVENSTFQADQTRQDTATQRASDKAAQAYRQGVYAQQLAVDAQTLAAANKAAVANVQARSQSNTSALQKQASQLKNHEERITALEDATNSQFNSLKNEVDENKKEARSGSAAAVAIASMPQVEQAQSVMFSAGAGTFKSESAVSVGASFHAGSAIVKTGFSTTTNDDFAMGAGVGIGF